jgi:hypothetical protein
MPDLDDSESENEATKPFPAWVNLDLSQLQKKQLGNYTKFIHNSFQNEININAIFQAK